jgi:Zn-dependent M28 family amino/carboxypeptidase
MNVVKAHWHLAPGFVAPLPTFDIGMEDAAALRRLAARGSTRIHLECDNVVGPTAEVFNVVAEIPGSSSPEEVVLLGAHLDSWDFATGAQDNGTGVAMVLEAARAIAALGKRPKRTLRFALWTGEEQGLLGSRAYAARHAAELGRHVAVLNTDSGVGAPRGFYTFGVPQAALAPVLDTFLAGLGVTLQKPQEGCNSDECSFARWGVPTLDLAVDDARYADVHHFASDTLDKVDAQALALDAAVLAVTAYAIANRAERLAPRAAGSALAELLKKADIEPEPKP